MIPREPRYRIRLVRHHIQQITRSNFLIQRVGGRLLSLPPRPLVVSLFLPLSLLRLLLLRLLLIRQLSMLVSLLLVQ